MSMRFLRLPWHRQSDNRPAASTPEKAGPRPVTDTLRLERAIGPAYVGDDMLGLLGIGTREGMGPRPHDAKDATDIESGHTDALIDALHAQYWRALAAPGAPIASAWATSADDTLPPPTAPDHLHDSPVCEKHQHSDSIETFLSGNRTIEDAFGRLDEHAEAVIDGESVPEILRLFAPPAFHAETASSIPAPPPLTRREHHALSVDSPLAAPLRKDPR